jgi:alanine racemase
MTPNARMRDHSTLYVDLDAIGRNLRRIRSLAGDGCRVCAVVKADAYGLGARPIAKALADAGADMLAVYSAGQAEELVDAGIRTPMLILMPVRGIEPGGAVHRLALAGRAHFVAHGPSHARDLAAVSDWIGCPLQVQVEIDTGMGRGGSLPEEAALALSFIAADPRLRLTGLFTHFSDSARDPHRTRTQMDTFDAFCRDHAPLIPDDALVHAANSHAAMRERHYRRTMVRPGLAWTGFIDGAADGERLEGVARWMSEIVHVKRVPAGFPVGYGSRWIAERATRLGIVPVGYADGYPLSVSDASRRCVQVLARGSSESWDAPVVGTVSMDQIVIDITGIPSQHAHGDSAVGLDVEVYGSDPAAANWMPRIADSVGLHAYELLCRIGRSVQRVHVGARGGLTASADTHEGSPPAADADVGAAHAHPAARVKIA